MKSFTIPTRIAWGTMLLLAISAAIYATMYLPLNPNFSYFNYFQHEGTSINFLQRKINDSIQYQSVARSYAYGRGIENPTPETYPMVFTPTGGEIFSRLLYKVPFWIHLFCGIIAILIGPFQFLPYWRTNRKKLHRNLGKVYIIAAIVAAFGALFTASQAQGGPGARIGFSTLAIIWPIITYMAYYYIRQGNIEEHRKWMIRSYACTFGGVTLRLWVLFFELVLGWNFHEYFMIVSWTSWVPNLLFVLLIIEPFLLKPLKIAQIQRPAPTS